MHLFLTVTRSPHMREWQDHACLSDLSLHEIWIWGRKNAWEGGLSWQNEPQLGPQTTFIWTKTAEAGVEASRQIPDTFSR